MQIAFQYQPLLLSNYSFISNSNLGYIWRHFDSLGVQFTNTSRDGLLNLPKAAFCVFPPAIYITEINMTMSLSSIWCGPSI